MTITAETFWDMVDMDDFDGCWPWTGALTRDGYGLTSATITGSPRAHRVAYVLHGNTIPEGLDLDHLCRNRACVRPTHLEPVTRGENVKRGWAHRRPPGQEPGYRTPARSFKPPPALYAEFKAKTGDDNIDMTTVLVWGIHQYLAGKVPRAELDRIKEEGK